MSGSGYAAEVTVKEISDDWLDQLVRERRQETTLPGPSLDWAVTFSAHRSHVSAWVVWTVTLAKRSSVAVISAPGGRSPQSVLPIAELIPQERVLCL